MFDNTPALGIKSLAVAHLSIRKMKSGTYAYVRESYWDSKNQTSKSHYLAYLGRTDAPGYKKKLAAAVKKYDLKLGRSRRK